MSTMIPLIDGGTEGFKGQARIIWPRTNACFECTMDLFPPQTTYALCTIASTPRLPEHCIEFASIVEWDKTTNKPNIKDGTPVDGDNPNHIKWLYEVALERAKKYNIRGVTYRLTQGVIKNIIPAIASTNAIVASACTNEALKLATLIGPNLDDYMFYNGNEGIYTYTYKNLRKNNCSVCRCVKIAPFKCSKEEILEDFVKRIPQSKLHKAYIDAPLGDKFSIYANGKTLYNSFMKNMEETTRPNLKKKLGEILETGDDMSVTGDGWNQVFPFIVAFVEDQVTKDEEMKE